MLEWLCMLCHIFHLSFHCVGCIFYSFEDIHLLLWLFGFFLFCQMDGQECLRTPSSYLCFSCLKLYSCYITKFDQVRFEPLYVRSIGSPRFVLDLNFQNLFVHFGMTESSISVTPRSPSWSRFSISVQPTRTFRSHWIAVTACNSASRCHRVIPLGHTDRVGIYIPTDEILENSSKPLSPHVSYSAALGLWIVLSSPVTSSRWFPSPSTDFCPFVATVANYAELGYGFDLLCYSFNSDS